MSEQDPRRGLPKVDALLDAAWVARHGHARVARAARQVLDAARAEQPVPSADVVRARVEARLTGGLRAVINATGVLLHTNLGRAPWAPQAVAAAQRAAGYVDVELELATGRRGARGGGVADRLCALTGAEAALVVNNCAAAVLLALSALAHGRAVLVSRGELVEIGGGFRVPDVLACSGARLVEVGTTNRTHLADFSRALEAHADVAAILQVHHSNFRQVGFVARPSLGDLVALGPPVVVDLGSGALWPIDDEPTVAEALAARPALVCLSGDKLVGGPQAGIVLGEARAVERLAKHPLARAMRPDKTTLAALEATLDVHLTGGLTPLGAMLGAEVADLRATVDAWRAALPAGVDARVLDVEGSIGGGSVPGRSWPSVALAIARPDPASLAAALRAGDPPVLGRVKEGELLLDARTVAPLGQGDALLAALLAAIRAA